VIGLFLSGSRQGVAAGEIVFAYTVTQAREDTLIEYLKLSAGRRNIISSYMGELHSKVDCDGNNGI
jgi:hypothetical protein